MTNKETEKEFKKIAQKAKERVVAGKKKPAAAKHDREQALAAGSLKKRLTTIVTAAEAASVKLGDGATPSDEPPHRHEVHVKNRTITVWVTLHRIPPQHIDVSATNSRVLDVSTAKHTKKLHLHWPFPHGMKVDASEDKATYEFEAGILKCVFPIVTLPSTVESAVNARLESVRRTQRSRLTTTKDGQLSVRIKTVALARAEKRKADKKAKGDAESTSVDAAAADGASSSSAAATAGHSSPQLGQKRPREESGAEDASAAPAAAGAAASGKKLVDSQQDMLRIAQAAGAKSASTLREKLERARAIHQARLQRSNVRAERSSTQQAVEKESLARVMQEQAARLARQEAKLSMTSTTPVRKSAPAAESPSSAKRRVSFAK